MDDLVHNRGRPRPKSASSSRGEWRGRGKSPVTTTRPQSAVSRRSKSPITSTGTSRSAIQVHHRPQSASFFKSTAPVISRVSVYDEHERELAASHSYDINGGSSAGVATVADPGSSLCDFKVEGMLGKGSVGVVYKVVSNKDGCTYVLKKINVQHMSDKQRKNVINEVSILRRIRHRHIVRYYTSFVEKDCLYLVLEFVDGGDMHQLVEKQFAEKHYIPEETLWRYLWELCDALLYMHEHRIIHRDLKTMNIMLTKEGLVKIGDMGVSKFVGDDMLNTRVGTPLYLAPEIVKKLPYNFKVDVWSLGVLMYTLSSLKSPFLADNILSLAQDICHKNPSSLPHQYTKRFRQLILELLNKNPDDRPSVVQVINSFPMYIRNQYSTTKVKEPELNPGVTIINVPLKINAGGDIKKVYDAASGSALHAIRKSKVVHGSSSSTRILNEGVTLPKSTKFVVAKEEDLLLESFSSTNNEDSSSSASNNKLYSPSSTGLEFRSTSVVVCGGHPSTSSSKSASSSSGPKGTMNIWSRSWRPTVCESTPVPLTGILAMAPPPTLTLSDNENLDPKANTETVVGVEKKSLFYNHPSSSKYKSSRPTISDLASIMDDEWRTNHG